MARVELAPEALGDFDRIFDHLALHGVEGIPERIAEIVHSIDVLATSPMIGRPVQRGHRELVIGKGSRGYVALYRYVAEVDIVFVLAIRAQREQGFQRKGLSPR